ncbi:chromosome transmission fidelity protein 4 [Pochonia chlamydosporia 170]|uniref:Chromosome transmission fidelity protein 4 n=1 Tax=Pochonia chlamydosporia 170 TaxID=1380566 RepID=A0A179G666_METCM|nr:chromosome transmission fidelity protein 4 [Pochonia chlamydosporia 170]OAQ73322.1 chromosome transmission fidelity protein 4 [Pochonia chlamydosporia 170]
MAAQLRNSAILAGSPSTLRSLTTLSTSAAAVQPLHQTSHLAPANLPPAPPSLTPKQEYLLQTPPVPQPLPQTHFDGTKHKFLGNRKDGDGQDPNKTKLGKTLRILQERLPTLLQSPLPQDILAPNISLQLFPTTHPHLPAVSGKVAYNAALWTSPIAWNRVPIIGNVKLEILAERMTSEPLTFLPRRTGAMPEQLVVRWCEKRRSNGDKPEPGGIARSLWRGRGVDPNKAFTGLFIFDFDAEGRVLTHTIEQAQEGGNWERGMGAKFVGLTDWLLGGMKNGNDNPIPMFERMKKTI